MHRTWIIALVALTLLAVTLSGPAAAFACTCPARLDTQVLLVGQTGIGSKYWYGHAAWDPARRDWAGADCSGFVVKAWQVPRFSSITEDYHPYGTYHLFNTTSHWYGVPRAASWRGDAVGYPDPDGSGSASGHVVLYCGGDAYGTARVMEAPGSGYRIRQGWRDVSASRWRFRRHHNITATYGGHI